MAINQLKAGVALSYVVLGLNNLVALLYTPYMLRMLGQSEFGLYSLVSSVIAYLTILDFGFGNAIVRYTAKFRAEGKQDEQYSMFGMFLVLYSIIGVISFFIGLAIYLNVENFFGNTMSVLEVTKAKIMILLMLFNLAITFPLSIFGSIISAYEDFVYVKIISIVRIVLSTITMVLLLSVGYKAVTLVIVTTVFNLLTLTVNYLYCIRKIKIKIYFRKFEWGFLKEVAIYSFFIFLNIIMDRIYWSSGQFILGAYVGTAAVAVFAIAVSIQSMYMSFSTAISGVFLPRVTSMTTLSDSKESVSDLFIRTGRIQYIILSFILAGFVLFGKSFVTIWAGPEYIQSYYIALVFLFPLTVPLIQNLGITILQARNQMKFRSLLYVVIAIISLVLQIPFAKQWGGIGVAFAVSMALVLGQIVSMNIYYYKKQFINIPRFWNEIFRMTLAPLFYVMFWLLLLARFDIQSISLLIFLIVLFSLFSIPVYWFCTLNNSERDMFSGLFKSFMSKK